MSDRLTTDRTAKENPSVLTQKSCLPKNTATPPTHVIPAALRLMRILLHSPNGFVTHTEGRAAAIAALHTAALVDLTPTRHGMHVSRRNHR